MSSFSLYPAPHEIFLPWNTCPGLAVLRIHMFTEVPNFALPPFSEGEEGGLENVYCSVNCGVGCKLNETLDLSKPCEMRIEDRLA